MKKIFFSILVFIIIFIIYIFVINTQGLNIKEYSINSEKINENYDNFKIVHFSDLLFGSSQTIDSLKNIVKEINKQKADIIIFTGDLLHNNYKINDKEKESIVTILKSLECKLYKYAIIGDHDNKNIGVYDEIMTNANFNILNNESTYLFYKDINPIKIIGLTDTNKINDLMKNEKGINPIYTILLTHSPDNIDNIKDNNLDLVLAGHSLGGQIKIPLVGSIIKKNGAQKYIDDYYEVNNIKLYISSGLGTDKYKMRAFNKPSINTYKLISS